MMELMTASGPKSRSYSPMTMRSDVRRSGDLDLALKTILLMEDEAIIAEANAEAERLTVETNQALEEMISRRTKAAEVKIAQAETQAIAEVRAKAADIAVAAAEEILTSKVKDKVADDILSKSIGQVKERLN